MTDAYIIDAVRTPRGIGKPGKGALSHLHPQHLAATVLKALKDRNNLNTATVDDIIWSTSTQKGKQGGDMGRMAALAAGYDTKASGMTLDRFCGGGITSVNLAAAQIMSGMEDCVIAGGTEMMSLTATMSAEEMQAGFKPMGMGSGNRALQAIHPQSHQGVCGDAIAAMEGISREAVDALGLESQRRADIASTKALLPFTTKTVASRLTKKNFRVHRPRLRGWPLYAHRSTKSPICRSSLMAKHSANQSTPCTRT
jgi:acetyl-CoA C-acetyltransferase